MARERRNIKELGLALPNIVVLGFLLSSCSNLRLFTVHPLDLIVTMLNWFYLSDTCSAGSKVRHLTVKELDLRRKSEMKFSFLTCGLVFHRWIWQQLLQQ